MIHSFTYKPFPSVPLAVSPPQIQSLPFFSDKQILAVDELGGFTNRNYKVTCSQNIFVVRVPGPDTDLYINRGFESYNASKMQEFGLNTDIVFYDRRTGLQIAIYIDDIQTFHIADMKVPDNIRSAAQLLKEVHHSGFIFSGIFNPFRRTYNILQFLTTQGYVYPNHAQHLIMQQEIDALEVLFNRKLAHIPLHPCHVDPTPENFLLKQGRLKLIDWEYSGMGDIFWDLAYLSLEAEYTMVHDTCLLKAYFGRCRAEDYYRFILYKPIVEFWITVWVHLQLCQNNTSKISPEELHSLLAQRMGNCLNIMGTSIYLNAKNYIDQNFKENVPLPKETYIYV